MTFMKSGNADFTYETMHFCCSQMDKKKFWISFILFLSLWDEEESLLDGETWVSLWVSIFLTFYCVINLFYFLLYIQHDTARISYSNSPMTLPFWRQMETRDFTQLILLPYQSIRYKIFENNFYKITINEKMPQKFSYMDRNFSLP